MKCNGHHPLSPVHAVVGVLVLLSGVAPVQGVIATGDLEVVSASPANDPGFANTGQVNAGTATYLGGGWVITAAHVRVGTVELGGQEFAFDSSQVVRLANPTDVELTEEEQEHWSELTDILLFRLKETPDLPSLRLPCGPTEAGAELTMIGAGREREAAPTFWTVEEGPEDDDDVWTEVDDASVADRTGYQTSATRSVRWGENVVDEVEILGLSEEWGSVISFSTIFDPDLGIENVAQAVTGDSGGGVFQERDGDWELSGMIYSVGLLEGQPLGARGGVYGDGTLVADVFAYIDEIRDVVGIELLGDIDLSGEVDASDIDTFVHALADGSQSCYLDLNRDEIVSDADLAYLLSGIESLPGDVNLDGKVDFIDFLALSTNFGKEADSWAQGDFDGNGEVGFTDFLVISSTFGQKFATETQMAQSVPEPANPLWFGVLLWGYCLRRRSRNA